MPSFPIVDSHVHLYDPSWLRYGWLRRVPRIERRYDLGDFDRCRGEVVVDKLVFAEVAVDQGLHSPRPPGCRVWPTTTRASPA